MAGSFAVWPAIRVWVWISTLTPLSTSESPPSVAVGAAAAELAVEDAMAKDRINRVPDALWLIT